MPAEMSFIRCIIYMATLWLLSAAEVGVAAEAPLADAAEHADPVAVRVLLAKQVDVNAAQADGMTALHWAAHQDDVELVKRLIAAGARAEVTNRYGVTPLTLACTNGNVAIVKALLNTGADPNDALPG